MSTPLTHATPASLRDLAQDLRTQADDLDAVAAAIDQDAGDAPAAPPADAGQPEGEIAAGPAAVNVPESVGEPVVQSDPTAPSSVAPPAPAGDQAP